MSDYSILNYWIIENDLTKNPGRNRDGDLLDGMQIQQITEDGYLLLAVVSEGIRTGNTIEFNRFDHAKEKWNILVKPPLIPHENGTGTWSTDPHLKPADTGGQDGDFTAQAGSGLGDDADEAASSAKA